MEGGVSSPERPSLPTSCAYLPFVSATLFPEPSISRKESSLLAFLQVPQGKQVSRTSPLSVCVRGDALGATGQREQTAG